MSATQPTNPYAPPRSKVDRPEKKSGKLLPHQKAGRVIRLMAWLGVLGVVGIGAAVLLPAMSDGRPVPIELGVILAVSAALVIALFFIAGAVMRHQTWGRYAGIAYGLLSLLGVPLGTIVGAYILWQLIGGWAEGDDA
jgi:hypothetical protein